MKSIGILKPPPLAAIKGLIDSDGFLKQDKNMMIGEVYDATVEEDQSSGILIDFFQLLIKNGYATRNSTYYSPLSFVYCKGSIEPHCDEGFGLVALWLVDVRPLRKDRQRLGLIPSLYSSKQWLDVMPGEIIIFNSNKEHAWLSNYHCSMILQTIRKTRRTRHVESN